MVYQQDRIVIWTSCREFAQYIELFNRQHKDNCAILVYKENPALSLPPAKDENPPDIIVGSWLRTDTPQKSFKSLDYLFDTKKLTSEVFYPQLLEAGKRLESFFGQGSAYEMLSTSLVPAMKNVDWATAALEHAEKLAEKTRKTVISVNSKKYAGSSGRNG